MYLINETTTTQRFLCENAYSQIGYESTVIEFVNGRDAKGQISVFQAAHVEVIEKRPSGVDDDAWLQFGVDNSVTKEEVSHG